ncbi:hypothetical protein HN011_011872 [Eciton burchellii]|nr:hypothetical protein HN011_011872 [Eciton burchellii]
MKLFDIRETSLISFDIKKLGDMTQSSVRNKKFPCPKCPSAFGQKPSLTRHLKYECGQEPRFQCPYCHFRSKKTSDVYSHVRRKHINYKVFAVDIYDSVFLSPILHISPHQLEERSSWRYRQQKQSLRSLNDNNTRYACPKCQRSYRHVHHMLRHYKFECGSPPRFQCPYCGMKSKQSNNVYKHIRAKHPGSKLEIVRLHFEQE